jgi:hypothetical protein
MLRLAIPVVMSVPSVIAFKMLREKADTNASA